MRILAKNKKWLFNYEVIDTLDTGIILEGHEVKSIKLKQFQLSDAHIIVTTEKDLVLYNMNVPRYKFTAAVIVPNYSAKRPRKLLVTKHQRMKLYERTRKTGLALIPVTIWESKTWFIKVTIALAKRKKKLQKRNIIKDRDTARQMDKDIKNLR